MADKEQTPSEDSGAAKGGKSKLLIIILISVLILVIAAVGAVFALSGDKKTEEGEGEETDEYTVEDVEKTNLPGAILPLETFIVNLQVKGSYLKTTVQLQFSHPEVPPSMKTDLPKVRDAVITTLSAKRAQDILSLEGKELLRQEIREAVNDSLGVEDVTEVFFTEFIIQ